jgi:response regulator RpfG family c-di-GMP phosphodiesterase
MALFQDTGSDPRAAAEVLADVLLYFGAAGDAAASNPPGFARRKASVAHSLAAVAELDDPQRDAIYFAGLLHAVGAFGASARQSEPLGERASRASLWDIPSDGARICANIPALPPDTADIVRWQSEWWDGTGYPDQLRWHGIPQAAVMLGISDAYLRAADVEDALVSIVGQSGRRFGPDAARTFTMWYHITGGEPDAAEMPIHALGVTDATTAEALLDDIADRVDAHIGVPGRWQRVDRLAADTAAALQLGEDDRHALALAARIYGAGELQRGTADEASFDPLARLGIDDRAERATAAAALVEGNATLGKAHDVLRARGEWFDGTGKPHELRNTAIPIASRILAAVIAYDGLRRKDLLDTAGGTQFDPDVVRAVMSAARSHA